VEIIEDPDELILPEPKPRRPMPRIGPKNEWEKESDSISGFIETLAKEISLISKQRLPHAKLVSTLATWYERHRHPQGQELKDTPKIRSDFRVQWWIKAQENTIEIL
jgi:hypothetical protein